VLSEAQLAGGVTTSPPGAQEQNVIMAATGELIRLINYVDDIDTTLRRISASIPVMDGDERKRLAEHLATTSASLSQVLAHLKEGAA